MAVGRLCLPCPGDDLEAGHPGHAPVDDRDVVLVEAQLLDGVVARLDGVDEVAGLLEALDEDLAQPAVILRNEHPHQLNPVTPRRCRCLRHPGIGRPRRRRTHRGRRSHRSPAVQPFAPIGEIVSACAATVPELLFGPSAVTH